MSLRLTWLSALGLVSACDAQVDANHQGTPLAVLEGSVNTARVVHPTDVEVAVVWAVSSKMNAHVGADAVEVEGTFPAQFRLSIYEPPSADMFDTWDGVPFGIANIMTGTIDADHHLDIDPADRVAIVTGWNGVEVDHVLVYLPEVPPADSAVAGFLRAPTTAGYHIYSIHRLTEVERQQRLDCVTELYNNDPSHMPTRQEVYAACGGFSNDELEPTATDLATPLDIEIVDRVELDDLAHW